MGIFVHLVVALVTGEIEGGLVVADEAVVVLVETNLTRHLLFAQLAVLYCGQTNI